MKRTTIVLFLFLSSWSCTTSDSAEVMIIDKMKFQEECWNNFDIDCFMLPYWNSDSLIFMNSNGITKGWDATLLRYRNTYPDQTAMGNLRFEIDHVIKRSNNIYQVLGRYYLNRDSQDLSGRFSLIWKNINGDWVIVSDTTI